MSDRKSLSKKTRFEIFKRDGFKCIYCGSHPPEVILEVDHIDPVSKGGDDSPTNLITSCFDCNRGKSDRLLSVVPESLSSVAERVKESELQLKAYRKIIKSQQERIEADAWDVVHSLFGDDTNQIRKDWFTSIKNFISKLQKHDVVEAAEIAYSKMRFKSDKKLFCYFCGICWNRIKGADNGQS